VNVTGFGYLILISRDSILTLNFIKNTSLPVIFAALFPVFGDVVKHGLSCLIFNLTVGVI